jgi:hypothetical protein
MLTSDEGVGVELQVKFVPSHAGSYWRPLDQPVWPCSHAWGLTVPAPLVAPNPDAQRRLDLEVQMRASLFANLLNA